MRLSAEESLWMSQDSSIVDLTEPRDGVDDVVRYVPRKDGGSEGKGALVTLRGTTHGSGWRRLWKGTRVQNIIGGEQVPCTAALAPPAGIRS